MMEEVNNTTFTAYTILSFIMLPYITIANKKKKLNYNNPNRCIIFNTIFNPIILISVLYVKSRDKNLSIGMLIFKE
jgi:hypothetical protein